MNTESNNQNYIKCSHCNKILHYEEFFKHKCIFLSKYVKFRMWLHSLDIGYILSLFASIIINSIVVSHANWSFTEAMIESFLMGMVLIRLLK